LKRIFSDRLNNTVSSEGVIILSLFLLALAVRLIAFERIYLIARDGVHYVFLSQVFKSYFFIEGLSHPYHPLYPAIMALVGGVVGDLELAGKLINLVFSSLTVLPLYLMGKYIFNSKAGIIGSIFFVFQPYCVRFSVDVLSGPTFLFFFIFAFYLGLKAGSEEKNYNWWGLGAGVSAGLAYLARPEGILILVFLLGWYFWRWTFRRRERRINLLLLASIFFLSFLILAGPYIFFIKAHTGNWQISMKPSVLKMSKISIHQEKSERRISAPSPPDKEKKPLIVAPAKPKKKFQEASVWASITHPPLKFIETHHYLLFLFLLVGIWVHIKKGGDRRGSIILVPLLAYLLCLCYLYHNVSYVSWRHFIPPITFSLPLAALGFWEVQKRFSLCTGSLHSKWGKRLTGNSAIIILLITVLTLVPKALKPQRKDKVPLKEAALWINHNSRIPQPVIMSNEPLVAYYARGKHIYIPGISYKNFVTYIRKNRVDYLVLGEKEIEKGNIFLRQLRPDSFRKTSFKRDKVLIYEVLR